MPARNEGNKLRASLKALAYYTDAIVYLDDCSTDHSLEIVESCRAECRIERILKNNAWRRDEPGDRNLLLQAGREIGGTHFIVIDADEIFTSNLRVNNLLRKEVLKLAPGQALSMPWIHLWRGADRYRLDGRRGALRTKAFAFCDDGKVSYISDFIHTPRVPTSRRRRTRKLGLPYGLIHFHCVNWDNLELKQKWYRWMERVERPDRSLAQINARYAGAFDEKEVQTALSLSEWFENYPDLDIASFSLPDQWRLDQIKEWEAAKGTAYFEGLDCEMRKQ